MPLNPCLNDATRPYLLVLYIERGVCKVRKVECRGRLWLGGRKSDDEGVELIFKRACNWLFPSLGSEWLHINIEMDKIWNITAQLNLFSFLVSSASFCQAPLALHSSSGEFLPPSLFCWIWKPTLSQVSSWEGVLELSLLLPFQWTGRWKPHWGWLTIWLILEVHAWLFFLLDARSQLQSSASDNWPPSGRQQYQVLGKWGQWWLGRWPDHFWM